MKTKITTSILSMFITCSIVLGQKTVKEKDILGNWKLVIEVDDVLNEAKESLDQDDEFLGKIILSSVSGFVETILDEIEIYLEFKKGGELIINIGAFGEEGEEYSSWSIDKNGRVVISDTEKIQTDNNFWILKDGILVNAENDGEKYVYMVNID